VDQETFNLKPQILVVSARFGDIRHALGGIPRTGSVIDLFQPLPTIGSHELLRMLTQPGGRRGNPGLPRSWYLTRVIRLNRLIEGRNLLPVIALSLRG